MLRQHISYRIGLTACGTVRKHLAKLSEQVAAPDCIKFTLLISFTLTPLELELGRFIGE